MSCASLSKRSAEFWNSRIDLDNGLEAWDEVLRGNYEGMIAKDPESAYMPGRTSSTNGDEAFSAANERILVEAASLTLDSPQANARRPVVFVVWDGVSRGENDLTVSFRTAGERAGYPIVDISTL